MTPIQWRPEINALTTPQSYRLLFCSCRTAVLIPADEWEQRLKAFPDLEDIREHDAVKASPQEAHHEIAA